MQIMFLSDSWGAKSYPKSWFFKNLIFIWLLGGHILTQNRVFELVSKFFKSLSKISEIQPIQMFTELNKIQQF